MKKIFTKQEINILLNSEETKKYPILINLIKNIINSNGKDLEILDDNERKRLRTVYSGVIKTIKEEWKLDLKRTDYKIDNKDRCSLCNESMRNSVSIYNKFNGKRLTVGLTCIKSFEFGTDPKINMLLNQKKTEKRHEYILKRFPDIEKNVLAIQALINYIDYKTSEKRAKELITEIEAIMTENEVILGQFKNPTNSHDKDELNQRESA